MRRWLYVVTLILLGVPSLALASRSEQLDRLLLGQLNLRFQQCMTEVDAQPEVCESIYPPFLPPIRQRLCNASGCSLPNTELRSPWLPRLRAVSHPRLRPAIQTAPVPVFQPIVPKVIELDAHENVASPRSNH